MGHFTILLSLFIAVQDRHPRSKQDPSNDIQALQRGAIQPSCHGGEARVKVASKQVLKGRLLLRNTKGAVGLGTSLHTILKPNFHPSHLLLARIHFAPEPRSGSS